MSEWPVIEESFILHAAIPEEMDALWAGGWRHFGPQFFRYSVCLHEDAVQLVFPLRVRLCPLSASKSQRRILQRNNDLAIKVGPPCLDAQRAELFARHCARFVWNIPERLETFLGDEPAAGPCDTVEIAAYENDRLVAASYMDIGNTSASSVYGMFDPALSPRSLGIATMLWEMEVARQRGCEWYYPGYIYHPSPAMDYKRQFAGSECYDWRDWRPAGRLRGGSQKPADIAARRAQT